jgi:REP element-mobilizing transposase RayT
MDEIGRKSLPHGPPPWACDTAKEIYFLTLCIQNRSQMPLLKKNVAHGLLESIRFYHDRSKWWVHLALIMPDHVHLLVTFPSEFELTVRAWKHWTAKYLKIEWQRDFFDHRLRGDEHFYEKFQYILQNPVRAGLVDDWRKWPHVWTTR